MNREFEKINYSHEEDIQKVAGFIRKLFTILNTPIYSKVICWSQDGKSLKILNCKELESKVLQSNFRHRNFHSFIRQLNMYGFRKMQRTVINKICSFSHPLFERQGQNNLHLIKTKHQIKKVQREERLFSIDSVEKKNLVEKFQKKLRFKRLKIPAFEKDIQDERMFKNNIFESLQSQKQNSNRITTIQQYQQGRSVQKLRIENFEKYFQQQREIDQDYVVKNMTTEKGSKTFFIEQMNKIQLLDQQRNILQNPNQIKAYNIDNEAKQYLFYEVPLNLNTSDLKPSSNQNLIIQKQSFVEHFPIVQKNTNIPQMTLTSSLPSFNVSPYNFQQHAPNPTYFTPHIISPSSYIPMQIPSHFTYMPVVHQIPSMPQMCVPQMFYNSYA